MALAHNEGMNSALLRKNAHGGFDLVRKDARSGAETTTIYNLDFVTARAIATHSIQTHPTFAALSPLARDLAASGAVADADGWYDEQGVGCECEIDWNCPLHKGRAGTFLETRYDNDGEEDYR